MDTFQAAWIVILSPVFFIYGINELRRGWKILRHGEQSLNIAIQIRLWLIRLIYGDVKAHQYEMQFKNNLKTMQREGFYSFIGGLIALAVSIIWIWMFFRFLG